MAKAREDYLLRHVTPYPHFNCLAARPVKPSPLFERLADGERTGAVSSGAWGPSVDASLAFGYVRPEHAAPGTELEVVVPGEPRAARGVAEARYDPGNLRPRA